MAQPIYSPEDIIAAGEALERTLGHPPAPWQVFQALGGRGKFARVEQIWLKHLEARRSPAPAIAAQDALPEELAGEIRRVVDGAVTLIATAFAARLQQQTAAHVRSLELLEERHAEALRPVQAELAYWRDQACHLAEQLAAAEDAAPSPAENRIEAFRPVIASRLSIKAEPDRGGAGLRSTESTTSVLAEMTEADPAPLVGRVRRPVVRRAPLALVTLSADRDKAELAAATAEAPDPNQLQLPL